MAEEGRLLRMSGSHLGDVAANLTTTCIMVAGGALLLICMTIGGRIQTGASRERNGGELQMHMTTCMTPVQLAAYVLMICTKM